MHTTHLNTSIVLRHGLLFMSLALLLILVFSGAMTPPESMQGHKKQILFSHQFHVKEAGVACTDCHGEAAASIKSSDNLLAKKPACQNCHEDQLNNNCTYCHT